MASSSQQAMKRALANGNITSLSACSGPSPSPDACCGPLLAFQRSFAVREPMFFLAITTQPELNTPCRKSLQAHLQASPVRPRITANVFSLCNPPTNASSSSSSSASSRRSLLPLVAVDPPSNKCPVVWVQDVDRLQNVTRLAKACGSADTACSRCASTLSTAAAALARYSPAVAARTAARGSAGNASTAAGEPTSAPSEAVMEDCARVTFVRVAQAQSWRAAPGLVTLQLDCPIV
ncbi:unnamed protein product [Closterium sp. Naga37s-1]|nr:unnamed protein product [Closterium sp. Naga37s-1]